MVQPIILRLRQWLEYLQQHSAELEGPSTDSIETLSIEQLSQKLQKLSHLLYFVVKVRGYKTIGEFKKTFISSYGQLLHALHHPLIQNRSSLFIVRFFPHQVQDLSIVISTFGLVLPKLDSGPSKIVESFSNALLWHFRYILLLWLSLICMIPFDLSRFDKLKTLQTQNISTYQYVEKVGWSYLSLPGKEREAAALVLARLMLRWVSYSLLSFQFSLSWKSQYQFKFPAGKTFFGHIYLRLWRNVLRISG
jgi:hypothetical protein